MAAFWILVLLALVGVIGYAAFADRQARKNGKVLVPVKNGLGRRTTFVAVDKHEFETQKAEMILEKQRKEKAERAQWNGEIESAYSFRRLRKRLQRER